MTTIRYYKSKFKNKLGKKTILVITTIMCLFFLAGFFFNYSGSEASELIVEPYHETIDGFVSFYVTGNIMVEAVPIVYNQRDSHLVVSVTLVKGWDVENYAYNQVSVYHFRDDAASKIDYVKSYQSTPLQPLIHYDPDFVFDFTDGNTQKIYRVFLFNTVNLEVRFAVTAFISKDR